MSAGDFGKIVLAGEIVVAVPPLVLIAWAEIDNWLYHRRLRSFLRSLLRHHAALSRRRH